MVTARPAATSLFNSSLPAPSLDPSSVTRPLAAGSMNPGGGGLGLDPRANRQRPNATTSCFRGNAAAVWTLPLSPVTFGTDSSACLVLFRLGTPFSESSAAVEARGGGRNDESITCPRSALRAIALAPVANSTPSPAEEAAAVSLLDIHADGMSPPPPPLSVGRSGAFRLASVRASTTSTLAKGSRSRRAARAALPATPYPRITYGKYLTRERGGRGRGGRGGCTHVSHTLAVRRCDQGGGGD